MASNNIPFANHIHHFAYQIHYFANYVKAFASKIHLFANQIYFIANQIHLLANQLHLLLIRFSHFWNCNGIIKMWIWIAIGRIWIAKMWFWYAKMYICYAKRYSLQKGELLNLVCFDLLNLSLIKDNKNKWIYVPLLIFFFRLFNLKLR